MLANFNLGISTGGLFALSSRLARYTANETYADWAEKTWTWMENANFIDNKTHAIYDGANVQKNCTDINKIEFSYVNAIFVLGAAHMYNHVSFIHLICAPLPVVYTVESVD